MNEKECKESKRIKVAKRIDSKNQIKESSEFVRVNEKECKESKRIEVAKRIDSKNQIKESSA